MGSEQVSVERVIAAEPAVIFAIIADPSRHAEMDGSGTVQRHRGEQRRLQLGSTFGMDMRFGVPYRMKSRVMEFEENRLIAWAHFGGHRWRYELEPVEGGTLVRETFDWSTARIPKVIELLGWPTRHPSSMEATLEKLAAMAEEREH